MDSVSPNGLTLFDGVELKLYDRKLTPETISGFLSRMDDWPPKDVKYDIDQIIYIAVSRLSMMICGELCQVWWTLLASYGWRNYEDVDSGGIKRMGFWYFQVEIVDDLYGYQEIVALEHWNAHSLLYVLRKENSFTWSRMIGLISLWVGIDSLFSVRGQIQRNNTRTSAVLDCYGCASLLWPSGEIESWCHKTLQVPPDVCPLRCGS